MNTRKIRVFFIRVEGSVPITLQQLDEAPSAAQMRWFGLTHWSLSADVSADSPPVRMHIYYHGEPLSDEARDGINAAVVEYVRKQLTGQE